MGPNIIFNRYLGLRDFDGAFKFLYVSTPILTIIFVFFSASTYVLIATIPLYLDMNPDIYIWLDRANFAMFLAACFTALSDWINTVGISLEQKGFCILANTLSAGVLRTVQGYLFCITFGWGLPGVANSETIVKVAQTLSCALVVVLFNQKEFKGVKK